MRQRRAAIRGLVYSSAVIIARAGVPEGGYAGVHAGHIGQAGAAEAHVDDFSYVVR